MYYLHSFLIRLISKLRIQIKDNIQFDDIVQNYYNSKIQSSFEFYNIIENNGFVMDKVFSQDLKEIVISWFIMPNSS